MATTLYNRSGSITNAATIMLFLILLPTSFLISLLAVATIKQRFSERFIDIPNERSSHTQPTPRGGGLGFILAFAITSAIASAFSVHFTQFIHDELKALNLSALWLILTPLTIIGIIDDRRNVPASLRYLVQLVTAATTAACFGPFPQPWLTQFGTFGSVIAIASTVIGITALINFYNFMDGLDGLVAGVTTLQLAFLALYLNQPVFWLLAAALLGFLWWNWSPAKIFMGDAGSTVLGASVAIALLNTHNNPTQAWLALAITLPLIGDAIYTLIRRLLRRENIFKAHRSHLYQRLQQSGWSHAQVAIAYITATGIIIVAITTLGSVGSWLSIFGVVMAITIGELHLRSRLPTSPKSAQIPNP